MMCQSHSRCLVGVWGAQPSGTECGRVSVCRRVGAPAPGAPGAFGPRTTCTVPMVGSRIMVDRLTLSLTYGI